MPGTPGQDDFQQRYAELLRDRKTTRKQQRELNAVQGYVYFLRVGERVKIGFSRRPNARLSTLMTGLPGKLDSFVCVRGSRQDEQALHQRLAAYRQNGEWFVAARPVHMAMVRSAAFGKPATGSELTPLEDPGPDRERRLGNGGKQSDVEQR